MTACAHPDEQRDVSISHLGDSDWSYCLACGCVLHLVDGAWEVDGVPGQITKATYAMKKPRR